MLIFAGFDFVDVDFVGFAGFELDFVGVDFVDFEFGFWLYPPYLGGDIRERKPPRTDSNQDSVP